MSSSSVSPRTPSLPSAAAPNTDVSALMPNHPPSLKFHPDTRHTDSCEPYRLHCIHLTDSDTRSFSPPHSCWLIGLVWGLRRDAYQWMTDFLGQHWVAEWRRWRSKFRSLSAELVSCLPEPEPGVKRLRICSRKVEIFEPSEGVNEQKPECQLSVPDAAFSHTDLLSAHEVLDL